MPKIFISYRREDSQYQADRLHAALKHAVEDPKRDIFIDIDNIPVGVDFVQYLDSKVAQCDVLIALLGPNWLSAKNPKTGQRRLDDPKDFVRIEIASALRRGIPVAPVLLDGTPFPDEEDLPDDLKPLVRRNGIEIRRTTFDADAQRLTRGLGLDVQLQAQPETRTSRAAPSSAGRRDFPDSASGKWSARSRTGWVALVALAVFAGASDYYLSSAGIEDASVIAAFWLAYFSIGSIGSLLVASGAARRPILHVCLFAIPACGLVVLSLLFMSVGISNDAMDIPGVTAAIIAVPPFAAGAVAALVGRWRRKPN